MTTTTFVESGSSVIELPDGSLDDALRAKPCRCDKPLPAPDDGEVRCTRCGHVCDGWGVPA